MEEKLQVPNVDVSFYIIKLRSHGSTLGFVLQSHSIHGMTEGEEGSRPHKEMGVLTYEEKKFLLAVERGDVASVRR